MKNRHRLLFLAATVFLAQPLFGGERNVYVSGATSNLSSNSNWSLVAAPFSSTSAGSYKDVLFDSAVTDLLSTGGDNSNMHVESYSVTNGNSYTLGISSDTSASFRAGATGSTGGEVTAPFTNDVSGVAQDLVYLSGNSSLEFLAGNFGAGTAPSFILRQGGNFNILGGSTLTINPDITGSSSDLTINGAGTTIFNGANTYTGTTTIAGGTLEIAGTNASTSYTISGNGEPVLKLSNVNALPTSATLTGSNSVTLDGTVDLAVAGDYTFSVYNGGHIAFTASSGGATSLHFSGVSKLSSGSNGGRTLSNNSGDLSIVFESTLDIGSSNGGTATITGAGDTTITGGILSTGTGVRSLTKSGTGSLTLNGPGSYTGSTNVNQGTLLINNTTGSATGSGNLNIAAPATLSGNGTVGGATIFTGASTHAVGGAATVGTQNFSSTLSYGTGTVFEWDLDASGTSDIGVAMDSATGTYDQVVSGGAVTGGAALFKVVLGGNDFSDAFWNSNKSWTNIFTGAGAPASLGNVFSGFDASGGLDSAGNVAGQGQFTFNGTSATLNWSAVPEPTSALAGLLLGAGLLRRQRNK